MSAAMSHRRPGLWAMLFGLMGAAAAWFLQTEFGETLTAQVCSRGDPGAPLPSWLMPSIVMLTACALLIGVAAVVIAWRNWQITDKGGINATRHVEDTRKGRQHFLATAGLLFSLLFLIGLLAAGLAVLLVSPCSAWR